MTNPLHREYESADGEIITFEKALLWARNVTEGLRYPWEPTSVEWTDDRSKIEVAWPNFPAPTVYTRIES